MFQYLDIEIKSGKLGLDAIVSTKNSDDLLDRPKNICVLSRLV